MLYVIIIQWNEDVSNCSRSYWHGLSWYQTIVIRNYCFLSGFFLSGKFKSFFRNLDFISSHIAIKNKYAGYPKPLQRILQSTHVKTNHYNGSNNNSWSDHSRKKLQQIMGVDTTCKWYNISMYLLVSIQLKRALKIYSNTFFVATLRLKSILIFHVFM